MNFREFVTEAKTDVEKAEFLGKGLKAKKISSDKDWDGIFVFDKKDYDKSEQKVVSLVANTNIWKIDYDRSKNTIKIRYNR